MTKHLPVLEDWSIVDLASSAFMTGEVDGKFINTALIESYWISTGGIHTVRCVTGQDYQLGEQSARYAAKYPGAVERLCKFRIDSK